MKMTPTFEKQLVIVAEKNYMYEIQNRWLNQASRYIISISQHQMPKKSMRLCGWQFMSKEGIYIRMCSAHNWELISAIQKILHTS